MKQNKLLIVLFNKIKFILSRGNLTILFVGLFAGLLISSFFWQFKIKEVNNKIDYKQFEITNLQDQIEILREDSQKVFSPTPIPTPIPFVKSEDLSEINTYNLSCYDKTQDKQIPSWINSLKLKLASGENLVDSCLNIIQNKVVYISSKEAVKGGYGQPGSDEIKIGIYDLSNNKIEIITTSYGNYLGGSCNKLMAWSKKDNLYYQCVGGDGPWSSTSTFQINIQTKAKGIIGNCFSFMNKTTCTNYCKSSQDCKTGYICNLEKSNCVKSCQSDDDCTSRSCRPLGPIMACE